MKKSYNPFKMWGSYVIPILAIINYFSMAYVWGIFCPKLNQVMYNGMIICSGETSTQIGLFGFMLSPLLWFFAIIVLGFLFGWGIHSLLRRLSR